MTTEASTTETKTVEPAMSWAQAAQEAAEIDPPPKHFRARLTCALSDRELAEHGRKYADADAELETFDAETKQLMAERKAERAEIDGRKKKHRQILSTGREDRDVDCVERVSIRQLRKWRVRLDTNQTYEEGPLSDAERQASLPMTLTNPHDPEDGQLELASIEGSDPGSVAEDGEPEPTGETDVTDPDALLDAAANGESAASGEADEDREAADVDESDTDPA